MAFNLPPAWFTQLFDNFGEVLSGGLVETYVTGTTTPKATYTDATGATPNTNPVVLDSAGRADVWLAEDALYRFIIKTAAGVTLETVDGIGAVSSPAEPKPYDFNHSAAAQPLLGMVHFVLPIVRAVTWPANFAGSRGFVKGAAPAATVSIPLTNAAGASVGSISISTAKVFTFTTAGGAALTLPAGDALVAVAGTPDASLSNYGWTLAGTR